MSTSFLFLLWLVCFVGYMVLDLLWVGLLMSGFYKQELSGLLRLDQDNNLHPAWLPTILIYILLPLGIVYFVYPNVYQQASLWPVFIQGGLFGLVVYGVYELTNMATLKNWSLRVVLIDILWGSFACGVLSVFLVLVDGRLS